MNASLRQRLAPARVWPLAMLLAVGIIALAVVLCPAAVVSDAGGRRWYRGTGGMGSLRAACCAREIGAWQGPRAGNA
jgi:hypothetical protein